MFWCLLVAVFGVHAGEARYVFLFIGDGMGRQHRKVTAEAYGKALHMDSLPEKGYQKTDNVTGKTTDSAAAGTALACGVKTKNGYIGLDRDKKNAKNLLEIADEKGMKTGLISTVSLNHATPATFCAHTRSRHDYEVIAKQLAASNIDYLAGGALIGIVKLDAFTRYAQTRSLTALNATVPGKRYYALNPAYDSKAALPWRLDYGKTDITLAQFIQNGIRLLDNPAGFVMMIEGGRIDWAGHQNSLGDVVRQTKELDEAVVVALAFYEKHKESTLIVVTADHETGGLKQLTKKTNAPALLKQKISFSKFIDELSKRMSADLKPKQFRDLLTQVGLDAITPEEGKFLALGLSKAKEKLRTTRLPKPKNAAAQVMAYAAKRVLAARVGYGFTSNNHTSWPVPVTAIGAHAKTFRGKYENTEIFKKLVDALPEKK